MKLKCFLALNCFFLFSGISAQSLLLTDFDTRQDITNDTLMIRSPDNGGWVGAESLNIRIILKNTGTGSLEVGAKKIEYDPLQTDVKHTICFGGLCYDTFVFESPFHNTIAADASDSEFVAHYLFDNTRHTRGINHIAYVFYDVHNPGDSSFVHVIYNTEMLTSCPSPYSPTLLLYPNPVRDRLTISGLPPQNTDLTLYDLLGNKVLEEQTEARPLHHLVLSRLQPGIYVLQVAGLRKKIILE